MENSVIDNQTLESIKKCMHRTMYNLFKAGNEPTSNEKLREHLSLAMFYLDEAMDIIIYKTNIDEEGGPLIPDSENRQ